MEFDLSKPDAAPGGRLIAYDDSHVKMAYPAIFRMVTASKTRPPVAGKSVGLIGKLKERAWESAGAQSRFSVRECIGEKGAIRVTYDHGADFRADMPPNADVYVMVRFRTLPAGRYSATIICANDKRLSPLSCDFEVLPADGPAAAKPPGAEKERPAP